MDHKAEGLDAVAGTIGKLGAGDVEQQSKMRVFLIQAGFKHRHALEILNGAVHARDLRVTAGDFAIDAIGSVGLDGAVNADGKILFSENLSQKILAKADGLGALLGDGKQIALPLHFGGTAGSPSITPDLRALSSAAKQKLKNRAAKELGDAIFGKRKADDGAQQNSDRDSAEGLIREGIGRFLGR